MAKQSDWLMQRVQVRCERCDRPFETTLRDLIDRSHQWCDDCLEAGGHLIAFRLVYRLQRTDELLTQLEHFRREANACRRLWDRGHDLSDIAERSRASVRYVAHLLLMGDVPEEGVEAEV